MGVVTDPEKQAQHPAQSRTTRTEPQALSGQPEHQEWDSRSLEAARSVLAQLFGPPSERDFPVRFWNGAVDEAGKGGSRFTLVLQTPSALRQMLLPPSELRICEAYIRGDFDLEGDIEGAAALAGAIRDRVASPAAVARLARTLLLLPTPAATVSAEVQRRDAPATGSGARHTPERDAEAVRSHYDVGNDFYRLWLDERMVYSCAYFERPDVGIDAAQQAKLDHICRKLRLSPGETLLDVGCGWGGLIMHAAQRYGVKATGVTLSLEQAALARERIQEAGLESQCTVEVRDYRHLPPDVSFDKIVSVGMVEHVGRGQLPTYFERLYGMLKPGGLLMNHGIVHAAEGEKQSLLRRIGGRLWGEDAFIDRYVFPDGELPTLAEVIAPAECAGFETRDVEILREHYAMTLRHWVGRLERAHNTAVAMVGEETYRIWRLYMSASAYGFASGRLSLAQTLLAKPDAHGSVRIPLTRADIYAKQSVM